MKHKKIHIGLIGCGIIGNAMKTWIYENTSNNCKVFIYDPNKNFMDDISDVDIVFIQIHIDTEHDGTQNLTNLRQIIKSLPDIPIFIRTTLLPGTTDMLANETGHQIYFMPEFLSERTAKEDFEKQSMIFTGRIDMLKKIFSGKKFIVMTSLEAEIAKYIHNVFGAVKVTYFNAAYDYCKKMNVDWKNIHKGILLSKYINDVHTHVPGPDGKFGYGGKCFPKDINSFAKTLENTPFGTLLSQIIELNNIFRN